MEKLWAGRSSGSVDPTADDFNSSIRVDSRMIEEDIKGSVAHATMLGAKGIIPAHDAESIVSALGSILDDVKSGALAVDPKAEDVHTFVESVLTERIGDAGKKLHTARSRNDQVALDTRLYLKKEAKTVLDLVYELIEAVCGRAVENKETVMPGYTHLQRAQPISFGHHLMAYAMMFARDADRIADAVKRMNFSPLGACALAGTTFATDRFMTAEALGFDGPTPNSIDSVSDRDFCLELMSALSILMMHLSRFSEEIVLWSSFEFRYIELDDAFSTGSSIMPQKKNPDMAELVRGKTGRVYGDLL
ncbi:MAG: argininosuccinate lyase, partial [Clostridia bacterium]|nr:argininosuccinate lyase [Clostridia bacterium]